MAGMACLTAKQATKPNIRKRPRTVFHSRDHRPCHPSRSRFEATLAQFCAAKILKKSVTGGGKC
jgi:hypothetical protein